MLSLMLNREENFACIKVVLRDNICQESFCDQEASTFSKGALSRWGRAHFQPSPSNTASTPPAAFGFPVLLELVQPTGFLTQDKVRLILPKVSSWSGGEI